MSPTSVDLDDWLERYPKSYRVTDVKRVQLKDTSAMKTFNAAGGIFTTLSLIAAFFLRADCVRAGVVVSRANHPYNNVHVAYASDGCSFRFSNVDFCDKRHLRGIEMAINTGVPNFNEKYILLSIPEGWPKFFQHSLVAIDVTTGVVYPLPIDGYSGVTDAEGYAKNAGKLKFNLHSNKVCISGAIIVHRMIENGNFCFFLEGDRFVGHHTPYMDP